MELRPEWEQGKTEWERGKRFAVLCFYQPSAQAGNTRLNTHTQTHRVSMFTHNIVASCKKRCIILLVKTKRKKNSSETENFNIYF